MIISKTKKTGIKKVTLNNLVLFSCYPSQKHFIENWVKYFIDILYFIVYLRNIYSLKIKVSLFKKNYPNKSFSVPIAQRLSIHYLLTKEGSFQVKLYLKFQHVKMNYMKLLRLKKGTGRLRTELFLWAKLKTSC